MKISFLGGARCVTGSAFRIETSSASVLVDCGLFQGSRQLQRLNHRVKRLDPSNTDAVVLTHAHIDHSGMLPGFVRAGFQGRIWTTPATKDLCEVMLLDSAHIQEMEAHWESKKRLRRGKPPVQPLYTQRDAQLAMGHFTTIPYGQRAQVAQGVHVRFQDAGHILGSAVVEMWLTCPSVTLKLVFSGDLGRRNQPIIRDPQTVEEGEVLLLESTYGNRLHKSTEQTIEELREIIGSCAKTGGKVIIPSFAVGRTQEVLYLLHEFHRMGELPDMPIFVDSPLAIAATEIFRRHTECFDGQARALVRAGDEPMVLPRLKFCKTAEESMEINRLNGPAIIIAASGMCNAGRIKHHLKHQLWRPETQLVFIGFQAEGTLGRQIVDGAQRVRIFGEPIAVRAKVHTLGGFSAHADQRELLHWIGHFRTNSMKVFVVHGEERNALALASAISSKGLKDVVVPQLMETYELY